MKYNFPTTVSCNLVEYLDSGQWKGITAIASITWGDLALPDNSDHLSNIIAIVKGMDHSLKTAYYTKLLELVHIDKGNINPHLLLDINHY